MTMPLRQEITFDTPVREAVAIMAEGNIGAATVLARITIGEGGGDIFDVFRLDDMNMRGTQVWVAYKQWALENLARFVQAVRHRDKAMIEYVNKVGRNGGGYAWLAVPHWHRDGSRRRLV